MARQCPVCGTVFPDYAQACDQHGVPLVSIAHRKSRRAYLLAAAGLLAALAMAPFALRTYWLSRLSAEIVQLELRQPSGPLNTTPEPGQDVSKWLAGKTLFAKVRIKNGSALPLQLVSARYRLTVADVEALSGQWPAVGAPPRNMAPGSAEEFEFMFPLGDPAVRNLLLRPPPEGLPAVVSASVRLQLFGVVWPAQVKRGLRLKIAMPLP